MCLNPKYNIKARLLKMTGSLRTNKYKLAIEIDRDERTIENWSVIEKGDRYSIPSDELIKIAEFFNCTITELLN